MPLPSTTYEQVEGVDVADIPITSPAIGDTVVIYNSALELERILVDQLAGLSASDIDTLAQLNAIILDATLIDTSDSRLSDARTPLAHTHPVANLSDASANGRSLIVAANYAAMRTLIDVDQAGTDNSTNVTLAGPGDWLQLAGQTLTKSAIDLTSDVSGQLPAANVAIDPVGDLVGGGSGIRVATTLDQAQYTFSGFPVVAASVPTLATHLANKAYVDSLFVSGTSWKDAARVGEFTSNITIAAPGATIDGVTMSSGNRVLLNAQTAGSENGLWEWNGAATPMTRPADHDTGQDPSGHAVVVQEGTNQAAFTQNVDGIVIDTGSQNWVPVSSGSVVAGDGLTSSGNIFLVEADVTTGGDIAPVSVSGNGTGINVTDLDGDHLTIDWNPSTYIPDSAPAEADDVDDLTAHLIGIDAALAARANVTLAGAGDWLQLAGQTLTKSAIDLSTDVTGQIDLVTNVSGILPIPNRVNSATYSGGETIPSAAGLSVVYFANVVPTWVSNFSGGVVNQELVVVISEAFTGLIDGATLEMQGESYTAAAGTQAFLFVHDGSKWVLVSRTDLTGGTGGRMDMYSSVATKAALLTQGASVVGFRGHITEVTNNRLTYVLSGTDRAVATDWTVADRNRETWITEAQFGAILTNYTDLEEVQIVNTTDGDKKRYRYDATVPEWNEIGEAGGGGGGAGADLNYTASPTSGVVTNTGGTDATLLLATAVNAGLMAPAAFTKVGFVTISQPVNLNALQELTGMATGSANLSTFSGTTISDNVTIRVALEELEAAIEAVPGGSGGTTVDNLTWSVAGSTGTITLNATPADPEKVRFVMRNGLTFMGTNGGSGQVQVTGMVCTVDTNDFGFPLDGDRVLAIYEE